MASRLAARALAVLFLLVGFCLARPLATLADSDVIVLESGASTIVDTPGLTRVSTGDPSIAGVVPIGMSQVVIVGKSTGRTTVFVWGYDGDEDAKADDGLLEDRIDKQLGGKNGFTDVVRAIIGALSEAASGPVAPKKRRSASTPSVPTAKKSRSR